MNWQESLSINGYAVVHAADDPTVRALIEAVQRGQPAGRSRGGGVYAIRNLLDAVPETADYFASPQVRALVEPVLGAGCFPVRGILFDKTPGANWKVPWHQDLSIAVRQRVEVPGFTAWTIKQGVQHVQPPLAVLESMLAVRLHLDSCGPDNGPLRVLPGSHRLGRLKAPDIEALRNTVPECILTVAAGDALLMRPLLAHASSSSTSPGHRRVLHIEFAAGPLPCGPFWHVDTRR